MKSIILATCLIFETVEIAPNKMESNDLGFFSLHKLQAETSIHHTIAYIHTHTESLGGESSVILVESSSKTQLS